MLTVKNDEIALSRDRVNTLKDLCHSLSSEAGWWDHVDRDNKHVIATKLMLIVSEISEAMEGVRKDAMDDKLPHRQMVEVELADALIRIFDLAGALNLDIGGAFREKIEYNRQRADHKPENRAKAGGKKF